MILKSINRFETAFQRFGECHKPLSYSGVFKDFSSGKRVKSLPLRGQSPQTEKSQHTSCRKQQLICFDFGWAGGITTRASRSLHNFPQPIGRRFCLPSWGVSYRTADSLCLPTEPNKKDPQGVFLFGWAGGIRTCGMTESKSVALPLGYGPIFIFCAI